MVLIDSHRCTQAGVAYAIFFSILIDVLLLGGLHQQITATQYDILVKIYYCLGMSAFHDKSTSNNQHSGVFSLFVMVVPVVDLFVTHVVVYGCQLAKQ